jgi:guanylate kinase
MEESLKHKIERYKTPEDAKNLVRSSQVVFLVGVTAAGKDTVLRSLIKNPDYHHIVSHTTRAPRKNHGVLEQNGVDYHFISFETAEQMLDNGGYVEAKMFSGNIYGTSVAEIQMAHDEGKIALTDVEVQGVAEYRAFADNVIPVFLLPPDFETWQERLKGRYGDTQINPLDLRKRLETAAVELRESLVQPYFEYVVNRDLDTTIRIVDEVAHGSFSREKNDLAKEVARRLLADLQTYLDS